MQTEPERIEELMKIYRQGESEGRELGYDTLDKIFTEIPPDDDSGRYIKMPPSDSDLWGLEEDKPIIVLGGEVLESIQSDSDVRCLFSSFDEGTVFSLIERHQSKIRATGTVYINTRKRKIKVSDIGQKDDVVRVFITPMALGENFTAAKNAASEGFVKHDTYWRKVNVEITPIKKEMFSKYGGLIETDVLADKKVGGFGLGSGGATVVEGIATAGVSNWVLMDDDRLEVRNVSRHIAGLSHVGRYKTNIMADFIRERNPYATIETYEEKVSWDNIEKIRSIIKKVDLVHCGTDEGDSKRIINRLCVEEETPCIFAGAFRRAYGGQVFFYKALKDSPCYQCALSLMDKKDKEISNPEQANGIAYSDRPVPVEPGLLIDIRAICLMVVKLAIQALLKDKQTTLRSLDDDLISPWYIWLNRREKGSPYEWIEPLGYNVDGMHILRWYGVDLKKYEKCPVCGDFEGIMAKEKGVDLSAFRL